GDGYLAVVAVDHGVQVVFVVADLGSGAFDQDRAQGQVGVFLGGTALQTHDVRVVTGEDLGGARGAQEGRSRNLHPGLGVGGDDALVVGELALDQSTGDLGLAEGEVHLVAIRRGVHRHLLVGRVRQ